MTGLCSLWCYTNHAAVTLYVLFMWIYAIILHTTHATVPLPVQFLNSLMNIWKCFLINLRRYELLSLSPGWTCSVKEKKAVVFRSFIPCSKSMCWTVCKIRTGYSYVVEDIYWIWSLITCLCFVWVFVSWRKMMEWMLNDEQWAWNFFVLQFQEN